MATCSFRISVNKGIHLMPEVISKGFASYVSSVKAVASEPANREPLKAISHREPGPTRSVEIAVSQEVMNRRKSE